MIFSELKTWFETQHAWQREAGKRLLKNGEFTEVGGI